MDNIQETRNVSYRGTLEALGPSIYQQGTHMLTLLDGRMILLESAIVDLDPFMGSSVEVFGALRPAVEGGGIIMRVEQVISLSSEGSLASAPAPFSAAVSSSSRPQETAPATSSVSTVRSSAAPVFSSSSASSEAPAVTNVSDATIEARIVKMAKEDISESRWSQLYCSEHIAFCLPIHKNWWYISFGNKAETLWHVEVSPEDFEALGSGIIDIDLIGGDISTTNHSDGEVVVSGGAVTGYRSWTQGRHFTIGADARLEDVVRYMTQHLRAL
jgi:hypothetical protein